MDLHSIEKSNLSDLLTKFLGYYVNIPEITVTNNGRISFESDSLLEHTGIMKHFYKTFTICNFNNNFVSDDDNLYWCQISFRYTYISGGSNGTTICDAFYNFNTKKWFIK